MSKPATKTLKIIDDSIYADQGTRFRSALKMLLPKMSDAYEPSGDDHRSHFGLSNCGEDCARVLWYSWKWAVKKKFPAKILRLFNRGHLEEARFLAMLLSAGFEVHFETPEGGQFKISDFEGHAGSAIDGVVLGLPELPEGTPALVEMKTHNAKSYNELIRVTVKKAKFVHYVQMQVYMKKYKLQWALYMAVHKDTDEVYLELVPYDQAVANRFLERSGVIIYSDEAPAKINSSPGWWKCKFCDNREICHGKAVPEINCRTCCHSTPVNHNQWYCSRLETTLSKQTQLRSDCPHHLFNPNLLNGVQVKDGDTEEGWLKISWNEVDYHLGEGGISSQEFKDRNV